MRDTVRKNLEDRFASYADLLHAVDDDTFAATVEVPKHKTLGEHLWCIVGARESYARALAAGAWQGFACSMQQFAREDFERALASSQQEVRASIEGVADWTDEHDALLAALAEHEVMHEGQIIRHIYALGGELPSSWRWA